MLLSCHLGSTSLLEWFVAGSWCSVLFRRSSPLSPCQDGSRLRLRGHIRLRGYLFRLVLDQIIELLFFVDLSIDFVGYSNVVDLGL